MTLPMPAKAALLAVALCSSACTEAAADKTQSDLTIFIGGDLLAKGGVVFIHPIPVPEERWGMIVAEENRTLPPPDGLKPIAEGGKRLTVTIESQASHVQFLYPQGEGKYTFRFRPMPDADEELKKNTGTGLLTIGGVNMEDGLGSAMRFGFTGLRDSGRQIMQVGRKGTDGLIGRTLVAAIEHPQPELEETPDCMTRSATSTCGYDAAQWRRIAARWEKQRIASEWEQRRFKALDACYRGAEWKGRSGGHCDLKSTEGADPIIYEYRDRQR
ncbi:hypothetical protein [Bosea sp. (in: a-proteobacteria)]|jgi:hypothetical protein|uniref:hypothetical protein n=1 Tax=Bosea sp. (in: a-proteobacteria) TaxID=1871050 RepID=UPI003F70A760